MLTTIESADVYFDTACKPLLVHCSDLNFYVAKYASPGDTAAERLMRDYLGTSFMQLWGCATQPLQFIRLKKAHLGVSAVFLRRPSHTIPMLGSLYDSGLKEVDRFLSSAPRSQREAALLDDFLTICFADIWLANEDRNWNNYNLMLRANGDARRFVPIDHDAIFNGGNLKHGLYVLDAGSSMLSTLLLKRLYKAQNLSKEHLQSLLERWYLCTKKCENATPALLSNAPPEWCIDTQKLQGQLTNSLFTDTWFAQCKTAFLEMLQQAINT